MTTYNKILRTKRLYQCQNCLAFYENRKRADNCDYGDVTIYEVTLKRLKDYRKRGNA